MPPRHDDTSRLVSRLLKRVGLTEDAPPSASEWTTFLDRTVELLQDLGQDRYLLEQSLDTSSQEMLSLYEDLRASATRLTMEHNELRSTSSLLAATIESTADGILVVDRRGRMTSFNGRFALMWGLPDRILESRDASDAVSFAVQQLLDPELFLAKVQELFRTPDAVSHDTLNFKDGRVFECDSLPQHIDAETVGRVWSFRDITEQYRLQKELHHLAFHDPLTELPNRTLFLDRVTHALSRVARTGQCIAVLFADLDDFQVVNDSLGHAVGDQLLQGVADRLRQAVRPGDTVARLGGDEFAILLEDGDVPVAAEVVARRVAAGLLAPIDLDTTSVSIRASLGIALGVPGQQNADELLRNADLAMYMAKRHGKERYELFSPSMHEKAVERLVVAAELRDALDRDEFEVFYQPIVDIRTGALAGAEALVRWNHPRRGFVGPDQFIPVAEATGLVVPLDRFVLAEACKQTQSWRAQHLVDDHFYISVNLSGRQLQDQSIVDDVGRALRGSELPATALVLEVTESVVMGDIDRAIARLWELKTLGLRLAVDDFGTGYSSLSYLSNLPVDLVKIDKSFIDRLTDGHDGQAMVRVVLDLSHTLGLTVIAEGIETEDQLNLLAAMGCERAQGYLLAKPMPAHDMTHLLERSSDGQSLHRPIPHLTGAHA